MHHLWRRGAEGTTQGDPLAMAMYALAVKPLIGELKSDAPGVKQVWYADDASGAGTCEDLRKWWDSLQVHGAGYGYYPNASKTHLVVKTEHAVRAREMFADTDINITTEGKVSSIVTVIWSLAQLSLYPLRFIAALLLTAQSIITVPFLVD